MSVQEGYYHSTVTRGTQYLFI
nr:hypothetical 2.5K protein - porcine epidemic diarrhea virus (isolate Belgian CV777) [Porcine epidemic diarrhea virus]